MDGCGDGDSAESEGGGAGAGKPTLVRAQTTECENDGQERNSPCLWGEGKRARSSKGRRSGAAGADGIHG
jgi:hypothetical protein